MRAESRFSPAGSMVAVALTVSAAGALVSMFMIGNHQRSVLLIAMFLVWVLSPYVALILLNGRARAWNPSALSVVRNATLLIALVALVRYVWVVVWPLPAQPASTFLIVPFVSWIAIGIAAMIAMRSSRAS